MSTITDPNVFAARLSQDCSKGWVVFMANGQHGDVAIRLGRYPVSHIGSGRMKLNVVMPEDFAAMDCYRVEIMSRKMRQLCGFWFKGAITKEVTFLQWIP